MKEAKQSKKKAQDLDKYFEVLKDRSLQRLDYLYKKHFEQAQDKEAFINICITKVRAQYIFFTSDMYMNNMVEIFKEKLNLKRPMREIVDEVQKVRIVWKQKQDFGIEYGQAYEPVYYLVNDDRDEKIVKWLVTYSVALLFKVNVLDEEMKKLKPSPVGVLSGKENKSEKIIHSFQWHGKFNADGQMMALHQWLKTQGFILQKETSLPILRRVFRGIKIEKPIIWHGELGQLTYLFDELIKHFLVVPQNIETIIHSDELSKSLSTKNKKAVSSWMNPKLILCFRDVKNKAYEKEEIKHSKNFYQNKKIGIKKPNKGEEIDKLIMELKKIR